MINERWSLGIWAAAANLRNAGRETREIKMMRNLVPAFTATALLIGSVLTVTVPTDAAGRRICRGPWVQWGLIQPGTRLGEFRLGSDTETLTKLAKPDAVESVKSETRRAWKWSEDETLFVHTVRNDSGDAKAGDGVTVDLIRFSYPSQSTFKTWSNISTGSTLEEIRKSFPDAQPAATRPTVYDDVKQGIAFEFEKEPTSESPCIAIMVHLPGQSQVVTQGEVEALLKKGAAR